jgi:hypothetical protein
MISRIPALEFLRNVCGSYSDHSTETGLRIWACGYGVAIDLTAKNKTILCGVAGAFNQDIECFVHIGLPNITRTVGKKLSDSELRLVGEEPPIEFRFTRQEGGLAVVILFEGQEKAAYALRAA